MMTKTKSYFTVNINIGPDPIPVCEENTTKQFWCLLHMQTTWWCLEWASPATLLGARCWNRVSNKVTGECECICKPILLGLKVRRKEKKKRTAASPV